MKIHLIESNYRTKAPLAVTDERQVREFILKWYDEEVRDNEIDMSASLEVIIGEINEVVESDEEINHYYLEVE